MKYYRLAEKVFYGFDEMVVKYFNKQIQGYLMRQFKILALYIFKTHLIWHKTSILTSPQPSPEEREL